jgi:DNA-binding CsgD family transcriptional regulator
MTARHGGKVATMRFRAVDRELHAPWACDVTDPAPVRRLRSSGVAGLHSPGLTRRAVAKGEDVPLHVVQAEMMQRLRSVIDSLQEMLLHLEAAVHVDAPSARLSRTLSELPPRAREVLTLLKSGLSEKEIALQLQLSRHTIHVYIKLLYRRFGVSSRSQLMALWLLPVGPTPTHQRGRQVPRVSPTLALDGFLPPS